MANWGLTGDSFILPSPWELVTPPVTTTTTTTPPPIGPLGFSITTSTPASTAASVVVKTGSVLENVKVNLETQSVKKNGIMWVILGLFKGYFWVTTKLGIVWEKL